MIDFKQYITELRGPKPANSNAQHDSDHDMIDVSDDSVVRKLNSFLGCIADMEHMLPEQTIGVVRRRLASIGLSFPNVDIVEDSGSISAPLTQFGGRFGKDIDAAGESVQLLYTGTAWAAVATSSFATNIATIIQ